jgi:cbb3-type cytochrome oxidase maturation protein
MSAIILLIFLGILVAGGFLAAFIWAVQSGQYDDDYSPSVRMLFDQRPEEDAEKDQTLEKEQARNQDEENRCENQKEEISQTK